MIKEPSRIVVPGNNTIAAVKKSAQINVKWLYSVVFFFCVGLLQESRFTEKIRI
jgi:hypothetical protein